MENYAKKKYRDSFEENLVGEDYNQDSEKILKRLGERHKMLYAAKSDFVFTYRGDPFGYEDALLKEFDNHCWMDSQERAIIKVHKIMIAGNEG